MVPVIKYGSGLNVDSTTRENFFKTGVLLVKGFYSKEQLEVLRTAFDLVVNSESQSDFLYNSTSENAAIVFSVHYALGKSDIFKLAIADPAFLNIISQLLQVPFIVVYERMILKQKDDSARIHWHQDGQGELKDGLGGINVGLQIDGSDEKNCVWYLPDTMKWHNESVAKLKEAEDFNINGAFPVITEAGDLLIHDMSIFHGSAPGKMKSKRRTLYLAFQSKEFYRQNFPLYQDYIKEKENVLSACINLRQQNVTGENSFNYNGFNSSSVLTNTSFKVVHPHALERGKMELFRRTILNE